MIWGELEDKLAALDQEQQLRRRRIVDSPCGTRLTVDGPSDTHELLAFCSNDYLGLANDPQIVAALCAGAQRWGAGSGAAHAVSGHLRPHQQLEEALAQFVGLPRALLFSTGFMANLGIVPALVGRGDAVFADRLNHASLIDAALASGAEHKRYAHKDIEALDKLLKLSSAKRKLILTDSVFSMDGDIAPLDKLYALAETHDAWLVIDDAHGFGVLGTHGCGSLSHFNLLASPRIIYMGTLGKAAGVAGAFVAGDATVIEWLQQRSRTAIFTTAHPPAVSCALLKSLELIAAGAARRKHLHALIAQLRQELAPLALQHGWQLTDSQMPIQPLIVGSNRNALELSAVLEAQGIWVPAIRPPTVPQGSARLRICLSAAHSEADVAALITALEKCA
ncbi:8-amino-7-oxononanoate synthase [Georgfuchsia toluolica]|uniref:8-amino-7-oxononanoate synthase n=1 Tax=Georgfuchsia toluolica TaxID=424218 RepID=A0A916J1N2_9PROT|nr:8-amino-7-oxononanoate synthase [Georgfuchsia toluolica]CAG4883024.1 8-amino-7-oxononanoate synthase [Georgfuchsia toluolica]